MLDFLDMLDLLSVYKLNRDHYTGMNTLLEQKVAGTKSREVAQCFEKFSELKDAGTKSRGTKSRGN